MALSFDVNYLAVLVAGIVGMGLGALWFGPLFGKTWMQLMNFSKEQLKEIKAKGMAKSMVGGFLAVLLLSFVLAVFINLASASTWLEGSTVGFWLWLGFVATTMLNQVLWENKPCKLYMINSLHYLVAFVVLGAILAAWP